jgi:hypothetical protein
VRPSRAVPAAPAHRGQYGPGRPERADHPGLAGPGMPISMPTSTAFCATRRQVWPA